MINSLTKAQEEVIKSLLPAPKQTGRPGLNSLTVFNAILWILSSGAAWCDLPAQFGKYLASVGSRHGKMSAHPTFCKVPQHATGALKKYANQAIGVSRGGKTTKIHALVTENFQLIGLLLTGGQVHDSECAGELLNKMNLEVKTILGDKAFFRLIFGILSKSKAALFVFPTKTTRDHYMSLIENFTKHATSLNASSCG